MPPDVVGISDLTVIKKEQEPGTLIVERVNMSNGFPRREGDEENAATYATSESGLRDQISLSLENQVVFFQLSWLEVDQRCTLDI
jgi:hypothetical protein